jgi:hypothetical protein
MAVKKLIKCLPILGLTLTLAVPLEGRAGISSCTEALTNSWRTRLSNWWDPPGKREADLKLRMAQNHDDRILAAQLAQQWLSEFHGLKVPLLEMSERLKSDAVDLLISIDSKSNSGKVLSLMSKLKEMNKDEQLSLFLNLRPQIYFETRPKGIFPILVSSFDVLMKAVDRAAVENIPLLLALQKTNAEMQMAARPIFEANRPPEYAEALKAWNEQKLKIGPEGTITYDENLGIPDRFTYELGKKVGKVDRLFLDFMHPEEQAKLMALIDAQELTLERALHDSHYQQLFDFKFADSSQKNASSIWNYIAPDRSPAYRGRQWWHASTDFSETDPITGKAESSRITGKTSKNRIFRQRFGPEGERVIYWPHRVERDYNPYSAGQRDLKLLTLSRISVAETIVNGKLIEVEVRANRAVGEPPTGFYFVVMEGDYVPARRFNGLAIEKACIGCHHKRDTGIESFNALSAFEEFHEAGFRDKSIIDELMNRE